MSDALEKQIVSTTAAPAAIGPYSQAVKAGGMIFASGQIPLDPATGQMVPRTSLDLAGHGLSDVVQRSRGQMRIRMEKQ